MFEILKNRDQIRYSQISTSVCPSKKTIIFLALIIWGTAMPFLLLCNSKRSLIETLLINGNLLLNETHPMELPALKPTAKKYYIDTPGCRMPKLDVWNKDIAKFLKDKYQFKCKKGKPLIQVDDDSMWIGLDKRELEKYYNVTDISLLVCDAWTFERIEDNVNHHHDKLVRSFGYGERIRIEGDRYVKVECDYDFHKTIFEFSYIFMAKKKKPRKIPTSKNVNVIVYGVDSVSRLNFVRQMTKTSALLKKLGGIEMEGYSKVDDNTYPNLIPVLAGLNYSQLSNVCLPYKNSTYDKCPFVWKEFKRIGYKTLFAEDSQWMGLFNYAQTGFKELPTDYYPRNYFLDLERSVGTKKNTNGHVCMGHLKTIDVFMDYVKRLIEKCRNEPLFAFLWTCVMTHDWFESSAAHDSDIWNLLHYLKWTNYLDNTIFFLMSDHGLRYGPFRNTYQGMIEERQPILFMLAPDWYQKQYPRAFGNFRVNAKRLTTHYDLHETIKDLSNPNSMTDAVIVRRTAELRAMKILPRGVSLFLSIPDTRTCAMAGVRDHWCTCHDQKKISTHTTVAMVAAKAIVEHINHQLAGYLQCEVLTLSNITDANINYIEKSSVGSDEFSKASTRDVAITLETVPGLATFEGTIRVDYKNETFLAGPISRTNRYGTQSWCVKEPHLKLYCFCKEQI